MDSPLMDVITSAQNHDEINFFFMFVTSFIDQTFFMIINYIDWGEGMEQDAGRLRGNSATGTVELRKIQTVISWENSSIRRC